MKPRDGSLAAFERKAKELRRAWELVQAKTAARGNVRGAKSAAIQDTADALRVDVRTVQRRLALYKPWHREFAKLKVLLDETTPRVDDVLRQIRAQFSAAERAELTGVGVPLMLKLANDRAIAKSFRKLSDKK